MQNPWKVKENNKEISSVVQPKCWIGRGISGLDLRRAKSEEQEECINMQKDGCFIPLLPIDELMGDLHGHSQEQQKHRRRQEGLHILWHLLHGEIHKLNIGLDTDKGVQVENVMISWEEIERRSNAAFFNNQNILYLFNIMRLEYQ